MILCDVNVLVYAFREDAQRHSAYHSWLSEKVNGAEPVAVSGIVASGFLRAVTHPRIFTEPSTPDRAFQFLSDLRAAPTCVPIQEGARHWGIFQDLCARVGAKGNAVPDAYLAALAIEAGCEMASADRGFARFPGLRWRHPLDPAAADR